MLKVEAARLTKDLAHVPAQKTRTMEAETKMRKDKLQEAKQDIERGGRWFSSEARNKRNWLLQRR